MFAAPVVEHHRTKLLLATQLLPSMMRLHLLVPSMMMRLHLKSRQGSILWVQLLCLAAQIKHIPLLLTPHHGRHPRMLLCLAAQIKHHPLLLTPQGRHPRKLLSLAAQIKHHPLLLTPPGRHLEIERCEEIKIFVHLRSGGF